ncbi:hypothetical protein H2201_003581 [Coniosporium apollinis]|uniref:Uncharacterized protein n=1 Tax=Coniosporium apollinis TaxID=61459 RepID=A0ABQ9NXC2_9PEZI|nr:hypothetical protein H2201_003581 [Coniosporium apollinis]
MRLTFKRKAASTQRARPASPSSIPPPSSTKRKATAEVASASSKKKRTEKLASRRRAPAATSRKAKRQPAAEASTAPIAELTIQPTIESTVLSSRDPTPKSAPSPPQATAVPIPKEDDWSSIADVEGEEEDEDEEPVFEFSSIWRVQCGKEVLKSRTVIYKVNYKGSGGLLFWDIKRFEQAALADVRPRRFDSRGIRAVISQEKQPIANNALQDIQSQRDVWKLEKILMNWFKRYPLRTLQVSITITVEELAPALDPFADLTPAPQLPQGRRSTSSTQHLILPNRLVNERAVDRPIPNLTMAYRCQNTSCSNYGKAWSGLCWIQGSDMPFNHYPISSTILTAWAKEIKDGNATVEDPNYSIMLQLASDKIARDESSKTLRAGRSPVQLGPGYGYPFQQPPPFSWPPYPPLYPPAYPQLQLPRQPTTAQLAPIPNDYPPKSSPLAAEDDPDEVVAQFIEWAKGRRSWSTQPAQGFLEELKIYLVRDGWDLDGLQKSVSEDQWKDYGFKPGYLARIRREIGPFKESRREAR